MDKHYRPGPEEQKYTDAILSKSRDLHLIEVKQMVDIGINFRNKYSDKKKIEKFFKLLNENFDKILEDVMKAN